MSKVKYKKLKDQDIKAQRFSNMVPKRHKCHDLTFISPFTKNNKFESPTALQGRSTQFPLVVGKCVSAARVLSLLPHRRASPLITWADLRSWGSAPPPPGASAGRKHGRSFV